MKYIYTLIALMILASCTSTETDNTTKTESRENSAVVEKTVSDIDTELSNIDEDEDEIEAVTNVEFEAKDETEVVTDVEVEASNNKVVKLDAPYKNPKVEVDMTISYLLDDENKIKTISVDATTYDLTEFNEAAQVVVGKTIEEAKEVYIAGWSLTNEAFKSALK